VLRRAAVAVDGGWHPHADRQHVVAAAAGCPERGVHGRRDRRAPLVRGVAARVEVEGLRGRGRAAQVGDGGGQVRAPSVDADHHGVVGAQFEPAGGAALGVLAGRAGVRQFAQQARADQLVEGVDGGGAGVPGAGHGVVADEDAGVPGEPENRVETGAGGGRSRIRRISQESCPFLLRVALWSQQI